jgi:hypothetical protein
MKKLLPLLLVLISVSVSAQNCDCRKNLETTVLKLKQDYPGYYDKVNESTWMEYMAFTTGLLNHAASTGTFQRCADILNDYLKYFRDAHLHMSLEVSRYWMYKKIDDKTIILRIPSFEYDEKARIDTMVGNHWKEITSTPNLIIDVRGNEGGIDYSYDTLNPLVYSGPYYSDAVEWYASEGQIKSFEDALAKGKIRKGGEEYTRTLIAKMKANPGGYVIMDPPDTVKMDKIYKYPERVAIIQDDFCGSSCEQFILDSKHSKKVTTFGCNTYGVLDYSNVTPEKFIQNGLWLFMPNTRSTRLPANPVDVIGIPPDVTINLPYRLDVKDEVDEWVVFVRDYIEKLGIRN